jgi:hypothetical protein
MDALLAFVPEIAIAAALAWGAGIRLYAVLWLLGMAAWLGWLVLPSHLQVLAHPLVIAASGFMTLVEFGADKFPWVDSLWDAVHTFIRIPAGAALAAAVFGDAGPAAAAAAAIVGGSLAAGAHLAKAGSRGVINTSPEPFTNWLASFAEDALVPAGLWLAFMHPLVFLALLALFAAAALLLARRIARGLGVLLRRLRPA